MSTGNVDLTVADQSLKLALAAFSAASQAAATQKQITAQQQKAAPPIAPTPAPNPAPGTVAATAQTVVAIGQDIKDGAAALAANPHTAKVGRPLVAMIAMAGDDANKLQTAVEAWYNSGMDRVSGWYKYRTQWFLLIIGFVMAVVINADTIHIARQLSIDPTLRQSIVAAANHVKYPAQASTANPASPTAGQATTTVAQPAPATTAQAPATPATASQPTPATGQPSTGDLSTQIKAASNAFDNIHTLGLPLGWPSDAPRLYTLQNYSYLGVNRPQLLPNGKFWEALLGWFLTAIAISLGAPFWFDALNKIMVIRSTVKPTEKSKDEASKS